MARPDDEQVEAPTFLRGTPLRITEGRLRVTGRQKRGENARVRCTGAAPEAGEKRGSLGGLDFDKGGHCFFADRVGPPLQSSTQLAGSSAAPHRLHDLRAFPSGLNKRKFPSFRAKPWIVLLAALKIGRS
jgi:hypothetical protein